ncbi:uncharacterized protein TA02570 [Theileria annulata]|uniref:Multiple myeloma tumor-associated protein 2-like N-terminal domain-containing protein n=1 Tax=Theileria annulata TaxID=5874 RepID=Q4UD17_THEAN|nr:uncharacterized protein TA02570 [Theileria annulata]CAI75284.1 hypothetical protein, conserved [Theileria annulata]|eukprot:XP_954760.1 hypothetical protein, conserved [Theileria annulata]
MIDLKLSPPREGTRGGREQFKWEELKSHDLKDREHYLGHSVKVGLLERKNKFYKHDWYMKRGSETQSDLDEAELTRLYEQEIMQEMLGTKPKRLMLLKSKPTDPQLLKQLLTETNKSLENDNLEKPASDKSSHSRTQSRSRSRNSRTRSKSISKLKHERGRRGRDKDSHRRHSHRSEYRKNRTSSRSRVRDRRRNSRSSSHGRHRRHRHRY